MSPLDIENIVAREGDERGWSAQTMAHVFELVSDLVGVEREACADVALSMALEGKIDPETAELVHDAIEARALTLAG